MKNRLLIILALGVVLLAFPPPSEAQRGYGMHYGQWGGGPGYAQGGWSYCPYCGARFGDREAYGVGRDYDRGNDYRGRGGYRMGPGMMGRDYGRRGMGPGMMGPGYDRRYDYPDEGRYRWNRQTLTKEEAKAQVEEMLETSRNPNLKPGDVQEEEDAFVIDILTKDGSLVDKMQVDKRTGMMRSQY